MKPFISVLSVLLFVLVLTQNTNSQTSYNCIEFSNSTDAVTVTNDGRVFTTPDAGSTWFEVSSPVTTGLHKLSYAGNNTYFAAGQNGKVIKSTDNGLNWVELNTEVTNDLNGINAPNENLIVAVGSRGEVIRSTDGGDTWNHYETGYPGNYTSVSMIDNLNGIIIGDDNVILLTIDGGDTWNPSLVINSSSYNLNFVIMTSTLVAYACTDVGVILKTYDGGNSWFVNKTGSYRSINRIRFGTDGYSIAVGDKGLILKSTNYGDNWTQIDAGISARLNCIYVIDNLTSLAGGENATMLKTTDGGSTWFTPLGLASNPVVKSTQNQNTINITAKNFTVNAYPNPFNPATSISYEIPFTAKVNINVYDITGRLVKQLIDAYQDMGKYNINFNAGSLSSGVYFVSISSASGTHKFNNTLKILLTK